MVLLAQQVTQSLTLVTPPSDEPVSVAEAKRYAKVVHDEDDELIYSLIVSGRQWAEWFTQRAFITQTYDWKLSGFPTSDWEVPKAPLQSITSITYVDSNGAPQTWAATEYTVNAPAGEFARPGTLALGYGKSFPTARAIPQAVTVRFVAGYGLAVAVPIGIKAGIEEYVALRYDRLGAGLSKEEMDSLEDRLWPWRVHKLV